MNVKKISKWFAIVFITMTVGAILLGTGMSVKSYYDKKVKLDKAAQNGVSITPSATTSSAS